MELEIIYDQQTPEANWIKNPAEWLLSNQPLIDAYIDFLEFKPTAIGLASNQLSIDGKRCMDRFFFEENMNTKEWHIIVNPKIIEKIGITDNVVEGCLTWPGKHIVAKRYRRIMVGYYNADGVYKEELITKFRSHVWQHEINHLDGVAEDIEWMEVEAQNTKYQRNDNCPCGSGKKYKKCCGMFEVII
jgi:peptide deformylase